jgi:mono/diheme cytochrome c family protein
MARKRWKKIAVGILLGLVGVFAIIQLVPYGRDHHNPPVAAEPAWDRPETRALAARACFDCHSNETHWPWYSNVAPASWLVQDHVDEGRQVLNFSEWNRPQDEAHEAAEEVQEGEMPPSSYLWLHPEARLSDAERQQLVAGLRQTLGGEGGGEDEGEEDD